MRLINTVALQFLLFAHTLTFAFAIVAVLREDLALLRARRVDAARLHVAGRFIMRLLVLLWITGLALIALDVGFDLAAMANKPKLAAKLTVVSLLTANGLLLHWLAFPILTKPQRFPHQAATHCAALGAISSVTWLYASFVGVARLIAPAMSYTGFLALYVVGLVAGLVVAMVFVRPHVERLLAAGRGTGWDYPYSAQFRQQIIELIAIGRTPSELSKKFGCHETIILGWLRAAKTEGTTPNLSAPLGLRERKKLVKLRQKLLQIQEKRNIFSTAKAFWQIRASPRTRMSMR